MATFNFKPVTVPAQGGPPPAAAAPASTPGITDEQRQQIIMEQAYARAATIVHRENREFEKPGTYLERIEEIVFKISANQKKGTEGQPMTIVKRTILKVLDSEQGKGALAGSPTSTVYMTSRNAAFEDLQKAYGKLSDMLPSQIGTAEMVQAASKVQPFAGLCAIVRRYHLPAKNPGEVGWLKVIYERRVLAAEVIQMLGLDLAKFYPGGPPADPIWVQIQEAKKFLASQGAEIATPEQEAAMSEAEREAYYGQLLAAVNPPAT